MTLEQILQDCKQERELWLGLANGDLKFVPYNNTDQTIIGNRQGQYNKYYNDIFINSIDNMHKANKDLKYKLTYSMLKTVYSTVYAIIAPKESMKILNYLSNLNNTIE